MQKIVIAAGGETGWHSHPGPAIALITRGELTLYSSDDPSCVGHPYGVGQGPSSSGQGHVHLARNLTDQRPRCGSPISTCLPVALFGSTPRIPAFCPF